MNCSKTERMYKKRSRFELSSGVVSSRWAEFQVYTGTRPSQWRGGSGKGGIAALRNGCVYFEEDMGEGTLQVW